VKDKYDFSKLKKRESKIVPGADRTPISIKLNANDLAGIKKEAIRLGIPYQTLINSVLHRFVTGELIDRRESKKSKEKDVEI